MEQQKKWRKIGSFTLRVIRDLLVIIGFLAILSVLMSGNQWGDERTKGRDAKRLSDVKQMKDALELYDDACNGYPIVPTLQTVGVSGLVTSFNAGCPEGTNFGKFMSFLPINPEPGGAPYQYCSETTPGSNQCGIPVNGKAEGYLLIFSVDGQSGNLKKGTHTATPKGIQ